MADQTDSDFAFDHECAPELRLNQFDKGMHELMCAIEELGCSEEQTRAIVLAGEQHTRINRMKLMWQERTAKVDQLNDQLVDLIEGAQVTRTVLLEAKIEKLREALIASDDVLHKIRGLCLQEISELRTGIDALNDERQMLSKRMVENSKVLGPPQASLQDAEPPLKGYKISEFGGIGPSPYVPLYTTPTLQDAVREISKCEKCKGQGKLHIPDPDDPNRADTHVCPDCDGSGQKKISEADEVDWLGATWMLTEGVDAGKRVLITESKVESPFGRKWIGVLDGGPDTIMFTAETLERELDPKTHKPYGKGHCA